MFSLFRIFKAEFRKYLNEVKAYYPDHIVNIAVTYIFFAAFFMGFGKDSSHSSSYYIGFICWFFTNTIISEASVSISFEKQVGTFSQLLIKPVPIELILSIRTFVWFLMSLLEATVLMIIVKLTLPISLHFNPAVIPVILITLAGVWGLGFLLAGLTLVFTKTASFDSIISYTLLFFTGSIVEMDKLPEFIRNMTYYVPLALGIKLSKNITDTIPVSPYELTVLVANSAVYLIIGLVFFKAVYEKSRKLGIITHY